MNPDEIETFVDLIGIAALCLFVLLLLWLAAKSIRKTAADVLDFPHATDGHRVGWLLVAIFIPFVGRWAWRMEKKQREKAAPFRAPQATPKTTADLATQAHRDAAWRKAQGID